jgi:hypothetical protein
MNPNRMGLEEQTEAHALLAKAANHPDWRVASHALDELMRRLLVLHRLLEAEMRVAPPGASKRSHGWQSQKLTSLTLLLAPDLELSLATDRVGARSGTCWAQPSSCCSAGPDARWPAVAATPGLPEVHTLLRNPQVELVPCRRRQIGSALVDTSKTMEGKGHVHDGWNREMVQRRQGLRLHRP